MRETTYFSQSSTFFRPATLSPHRVAASVRHSLGTDGTGPPSPSCASAARESASHCWLMAMRAASAASSSPSSSSSSSTAAALRRFFVGRCLSISSPKESIFSRVYSTSLPVVRRLRRRSSGGTTTRFLRGFLAAAAAAFPVLPDAAALICISSLSDSSPSRRSSSMLRLMWRRRSSSYSDAPSPASLESLSLSLESESSLGGAGAPAAGDTIRPSMASTDSTVSELSFCDASPPSSSSLDHKCP